MVGVALLTLSTPPAMAMSFGRTVTATTLGQPLDFVAHLAVDVDETLPRECVGAEVSIGDNRVARENTRVTLEPARDAGERRVRVTTRTIVDEPVVTVDVTVGCNSQMSRRFVAFVDPPMLRLASATPDESLAPQRVHPQVAPLLDIVRSADASRQRTAHRDAAADGSSVREKRRSARRSAPGQRFAAAPVARERAVGPARVAARRTTRPESASAGEPGMARATPRLRLDAAPDLSPPVRIAATTPVATPLAPANDPTATASLAAAAEAASAALASERVRVAELEAGLARLRSDSQAQQKTLGALQARLRQADGDRYANGLVYALAAATVFFALLSAAFWALRPRQRKRARWFDAQAAQQRRVAAAPVAAPAVAPPPRADSGTQTTPAGIQHASQWGESAHGGLLQVTTPATIGGLEVTTVLAPQSHYARLAAEAGSAHGAGAAVARSSSLSMEELIDLEQQVELYVVLGQDEAAIALLTAHLGAVGSASPLPFLQLLEIHQRRGDRIAYEALREEYHEHFDAFAPEWSADLHFGRSLEEYPQMIARLQALWATPLHAMRTLDGLLFRRNESDEAFDFPACRELLFLYSVARELAGQVETDFGTIDLFLPLEDAPLEPAANQDGRFAVDLDVSGWPDDAQGLEIRRSVGRRGAA